MSFADDSEFLTVPRLRGVWGAALHSISLPHYEEWFGDAPDRRPRYMIRPAPMDHQSAPTVEYVVYGPTKPLDEAVLWHAWDMALARGLGPRRVPTKILGVTPIGTSGQQVGVDRASHPFILDQVQWSVGNQGVRLVFPWPLRLLRSGVLIGQPTLADISVAALRRVAVLATGQERLEPTLRDDVLRAAQETAASSWCGQPFDLCRYSASQHAEIELRGVTGSLDLPRGMPLLLTKLLTAACWTHLGKGTAMGLGALNITPLPD
jgi:hypothetical protein